MKYQCYFVSVKYCLQPFYPVDRSTPIDTGNSFNDTVTYKCDIGYQFADNDTVKTFFCQANETWEVPPTECEGKLLYMYSPDSILKRILLPSVENLNA